MAHAVSCRWRCWRRFACCAGDQRLAAGAAAGLPPLLATLSTSVAFTGLTDLLTGQRRIAVAIRDGRFRDNSVLGLPGRLVYLLGVYPVPVPAPPLPLRPACAGGGRHAMAQMSGLNVRRLTLLVWLLAGSRRAGYSAAAQPGSGSSSGTATPLLLETVLATLSAPPSRAVGGHHLGALLGQSGQRPLNGLGLLGSISSGWAPLKAA